MIAFLDNTQSYNYVNVNYNYRFKDVRCLTIMSPGRKCSLCLNVCVEKDYTLTLDQIKDELKSLSDFADQLQLDDMIEIDEDTDFNQELTLLSQQLVVEGKGQYEGQQPETSNIGYIPCPEIP